MEAQFRIREVPVGVELNYFSSNNREMLMWTPFPDMVAAKKWISLLKQHCLKAHIDIVQRNGKFHFQQYIFPTRMLCMSHAYESAQKAREGRDSVLREMRDAQIVSEMIEQE